MVTNNQAKLFPHILCEKVLFYKHNSPATMFLMVHRWFAKRFLHPDIVTEYSYIFLWDEDLGVDDFDPDRYGRLFYYELVTAN